jgi:3-hydroxybutyryl-CoA dehydrogenase
VRKERIAVIGAGLMGHGIAQVFAANGYPVAVFDADAAALAQVPERVRANLGMLGQPQHAVDAISLHDSLRAAVRDADVVFEAVPEKLALKQAIFAELAAETGPGCLLASNTSVIPIGEITAGLAAASRMLGAHWWNPPYLIPLVEVVQGERTAPESVERCIALLTRAGKMAVHVKRDVPGFVGNRLQHALWREAIALVASGVCDAHTVDCVVKNSFGIRLPVLGPLENADLVGLDLTLDVHEVILRHLDASGAPSPVLAEHVRQQRLGMKSGQGFYRWTDDSARAAREGLIAHLRDALGTRMT